MNNNDTPVLLSKAQAIKAFGIGRIAIEKLVADGAVKSLIVGKRRKIVAASVAEYIRNRAGGVA